MNKINNNEICKTKYPIVFIHGIGFRNRKFPNYWGRIPKKLQLNGAKVFYTNQDAWGSLQNNSLIIKNDILDILKVSGAEKVNIIAHSNGGIEGRYIIHELEMEQYIASLTTICTCHHGSKTIDYVIKLPKVILNIVAFFVNLFFRILGDKKPDFLNTCQQLSTSFCLEFNEKITDSPKVKYISYAAKMKNVFSDIMLAFPFFVVKHIDGDNDGLVPVESAKWGDFKGVIEGNSRRGVSHADAVDYRRHKTKSFDICQKYVNITAELRKYNL